MGRLAFEAFPRAISDDGTVSPGAQMFIWQAGSTTPITTYSDPTFLFPQSNPIIADAAGYFPQIYIDGEMLLKVRVLNADGVLLYEADYVEQGNANRLTENDVDALLADETLTYSAGSGRIVAPGDYVETRKEGFSYIVAASDATDYDVTTSHATTKVKLLVVPSHAGFLPEQFGADPIGATDATEAAQLWLTRMAVSGGRAKASGTYRISMPASPSDPDGVAALYMAVPKSTRPTHIDLTGSRWNYYGDPDTYMFRFFQSGNQAFWTALVVEGGYFDGSNTTDPLGAILWDDMGQSQTEGMHLHGWQREAGDENAVAIEQRNVDSWSENCKHRNHIITNCDAIWRSSLASGGSGTFSMARTELGPFFCSGLKAFGVINGMAMYDSVIHGPVGNSGRIAWVRNSGGAVANTEVEGLKTEQGRSAITAAGGAISSGSTTLNVSTGTPFQDWMAQGQRVVIPGAGAAGADLETWITGYVSSTEVTVNHSASTTVSGVNLTLRATASILEAGSLQKFSLNKVYNRDGGRSVDELQYTGGTSGYAAIPMGALSVLGSGVFGGTVTGRTFATVNKREFSGTVTLDGTDSSTWVKVQDGDGDTVLANRSLVEATVVLSQQLYAIYRVIKLGDTGVDGGGLLSEKRNTGTYSQPLEIRINGTDLEMRSAADLAAWRGVTLQVDVTRYQ